MVVNSLRSMDIGENQYAGHNHVHLEALEVPKVWLCCIKMNSKIEFGWYIRMWMHDICRYAFKGVTGKSYILRYAISHLPTQGLHPMENRYTPHYMRISWDFVAWETLYY
jgi:hypothetical protein